VKKLIYILFLFPTILFAQRNLPLNRQWSLESEKTGNRVSKEEGVYSEFSSFKPLIIHPTHIDKNDSARKATSVWKRKIKQESLFIVNDTADKFYLTLDPLFNFEAGMDMAYCGDPASASAEEGRALVAGLGAILAGPCRAALC